MQLYVTVKDPFPALVQAINGPCSECLFEALAYYEDNNLEVDASKS